jgi:hypothetical protein
MAENARWGFDVSRGEPLVIALARSFLFAEKKIRSISSSLSKGGHRVHGHEKVSKKPTSLQAMSPALEKKYTAPPPDVTRDKL